MKKYRFHLFLAGFVILAIIAARSIVGCGLAGGGSSSGALAVLSFLPTEQTGGFIDTKVFCLFSKDLESSTINPSTFTLLSPEGAVAGAVTYEAGSRTATFMPAAKLAYSTAYVATISAEVKDTGGASLRSPFSWSFTTADRNYSAVGSPDAVLGDNGIVMPKDIGEFLSSAALNRLAIDPTGKLVVMGRFNTNPRQADYKIMVWRCDSSGVIDRSFGNNGFALINSAYGLGLAVDPAGKILIAGKLGRQMAAWRLLPDGSPDSTFGNSGIVTDGGYYTSASSEAAGNAIALDSNGRILIAGASVSSSDPTNNLSCISLWCLEPNGSPAAGFGSGGAAYYHDVLSFGASDLVIDHSNNIYMTGSFTLKYDPSGNLVAGFGSGGKVNAGGTGINLGPNGKIFIVIDRSVSCYNPDGTIDTAFGTGGVATIDPLYGPMTENYGQAITIEASGKILATGYILPIGALTDNEMITWRLNADGTLDTGFGKSGLITQFAAGGKDIEIDSLGRILVAGWASESDALLAPRRTVLWRYR